MLKTQKLRFESKWVFRALWNLDSYGHFYWRATPNPLDMSLFIYIYTYILLVSLSFYLSDCTFSFRKPVPLNPIQFLAAWGSFKGLLHGQARRSSHPPPDCLREQKHSSAVKHTDPPRHQQWTAVWQKSLFLLCSQPLPPTLSLLTLDSDTACTPHHHHHFTHSHLYPKISLNPDILLFFVMAFFSPPHIFYSGVAPSLYNLSLLPSLTLASVSSFTLSICLLHHLPFLISSFLSSPVSLPGTPALCLISIFATSPSQSLPLPCTSIQMWSDWCQV